MHHVPARMRLQCRFALTPVSLLARFADYIVVVIQVQAITGGTSFGAFDEGREYLVRDATSASSSDDRWNRSGDAAVGTGLPQRLL